METSATYAGLDDAVRAVAYGGTIASCAYYEGDSAPLSLDAEFHRNAVEIKSVQPGSSHIMDYHPRWEFEHLRSEAFRLLESGALAVDGLIDPIVPLEEAAGMIESLAEDQTDSVKLGVTFE